jgi:hypothetical protein
MSKLCYFQFSLGYLYIRVQNDHVTIKGLAPNLGQINYVHPMFVLLFKCINYFEKIEYLITYYQIFNLYYIYIYISYS